MRARRFTLIARLQRLVAVEICIQIKIRVERLLDLIQTILTRIGQGFHLAVHFAHARLISRIIHSRGKLARHALDAPYKQTRFAEHDRQVFWPDNDQGDNADHHQFHPPDIRHGVPLVTNRD